MDRVLDPRSVANVYVYKVLYPLALHMSTKMGLGFLRIASVYGNGF